MAAALAPSADRGQALDEVFGVELRYLAELPRPTTLTLRAGPLTVELTSDRERYAAARPGTATLSPLEYELLAVALADGRCTRADATKALAWKAADPSRRLTRERLLGPVAAPDGGGERWTVRELVGALGGELERVEVHGG